MPKKTTSSVIEEDKTQVENEKPKRTRTMSAEALEKLKKARELAIKAKKEKAEIENKHKEIKETFGSKVNDIETFNTLKQKAKAEADDEVKKNEIVMINQRLNDIHNKFDGFLQDRERSKIEKAKRKEEKKAKQIVSELPMALSQKLLEDEVKRQELERFREKYFGIRRI
jgi:hypothetical protein